LPSGIAGAGAIPASVPFGRSSLFFARNSLMIIPGQHHAPTTANGLDYTWPGGTCKGGYAWPRVQLVWTHDANLTGHYVDGDIAVKPLLAVCHTNGFSLAWNSDGSVTRASWRRGQTNIESLVPPGGANGVHVILQGSTMSHAWWTDNGAIIQPTVHVPSLVNEMHWYGFSIPVGTSGVPSYATLRSKGHMTSVTAPANADELHVQWSKACDAAGNGPVVWFQFTDNGTTWTQAGYDCKFNGLQFAWNEKGFMTSVDGFHKGAELTSIVGVVNTNDAHLPLPSHVHLIDAWWAYNGEPISKIKLPSPVTQVSWYGYQPTRAHAKLGLDR